MPRFHFTITSPQGRTECGFMDLPCARSAIPEALQIGMDIMNRAENTPNSGERWLIGVSDDDAHPVYRFQMHLPNDLRGKKHRM